MKDPIGASREIRCNARRRLIGVAVALQSLVLALGTAAATPVRLPMRFDRLTLDDGLSQSAVVAIAQDSEGYMWLGTENGLNRYDGYEFEHFKRERGNADALKSDFIYDVAEGADGRLWVATNGGGLAALDRRSGVVSSYRHEPSDPTSIAGDIVRTVLIGRDGSIWLGLRNAGLDRLDPSTGAFTHYTLGSLGTAGAVPTSVHVLYEDRAGTLWIGADDGLLRLDPERGELTAYRHDPANAASLSENRVRMILEDGDGTLWVGTYGGGLNRLDRDTGTFTHYRHDPADPRSISHNRVTTALEDRDGRLWIGTSRGLNLLDKATGTFTRYMHQASDPSSLGADEITTLYEDRSGILWVGTLTAGVSKWNPRTWGLGLRDAADLASERDTQPNVTAFATDSSGTVWIGTFGEGLKALDRADGSIVTYRHAADDPRSISDDRVMSLALTRNGVLWIGTMTGGLNRLDPATGEVTVYRHDPADADSLSADGVMAVYEDRDGRIWAGTFGGGISVYDPRSERFTRFAADPSRPGALTSARVTSFAEDPSGKLWVGTDAGGLNLFDPATQTFTSFRYDADDPRSLADDTVYTVHVDAAGTVWVGTSGGGLDRVDGRAQDPASIRFTNLSQVDGLSNDVVYGIHSDASGHLWLSTNYGLNRVDPRSGEIKTWHRRDGLQSDEFNFGAHHRSAEGELFFGGHHGFNAFDPAELESNDAVPPVVLTGFFRSNERVAIDPAAEAALELDYGDDTVSFEFAALDFAAPARNRYMYKLEGFDRDWVDLGNRRRVTYTDLDHGAYLLRVKAANSDGVWNEAGLSLPLRVAPAPWETWWAYLGYAAMALQAALLLWLGHRRKLRREEQYRARLEAEVETRTAELAERNEELQRLNRSLQESTLTDPLTGLRNRRFVFEEMSRDMASVGNKYAAERRGLDPSHAAEMVFMMIDLDEFKPINDTYGHAAGDQVLLEIRDVLLETCRRSDFVVRWGGDEFVVIAKQTHASESEALAERIRQAIANHKFVLPDGQVVRTTCSIGFVAFPLFRGQAEDATIDDLIQLADGLMYEAKRQRNAWVGMLGINEAVTSEDFMLPTLDPTSLLFRPQRAGRIFEHRAHAEGHAAEEPRAKAG